MLALVSHSEVIRGRRWDTAIKQHVAVASTAKMSAPVAASQPLSDDATSNRSAPMSPQPHLLLPDR